MNSIKTPKWWTRIGSQRAVFALLVALLTMIGMAAFVLASDVSDALWHGDIIITNEGAAATAVSVNMSLNSAALIENGYASADLTDVAVHISGTDTFFMPGSNSTNPWVIWVPSIGASQSISYDLYTGNVTGGEIRYFPGAGGMATANSTSLKLGNVFIIEQKGRVNTDNGTDKLLVEQGNVFRTYVSDTTNGTIISSIGVFGAWTTPSGHDSVVGWADPADAHDDLLGTEAVEEDVPVGAWSNVYEATFPSANISGIRARQDMSAYDTVNITAYHDGAWYDVYLGDMIQDAWVEWEYWAENVTKLGFRWKNIDGGEFSDVNFVECDYRLGSYVSVTASDVSSGEYTVVTEAQGFNYRQQITINGSTNSSQTDYQMEVAVIKESGTSSGNTVYLNNHCQDDFDDIRFTKADGVTKLDYWLQEYTSGDSATFWVEFDSIPISPASPNFYIYYDHALASSNFSGSDTWIYFDDFSTDRIVAEWGGDTTYASVADGTLTWEIDIVAGKGMNTSENFTCNKRAITRAFTGSRYPGWGFMPDPPGYTKIQTGFFADQSTVWVIGNGYSSKFQSDWTRSIYSVFEVFWTPNRAEFYQDGAEVYGSPRTTVNSTAAAVGIGDHYNNNTPDLFDWMAVGKAIYPEPTWGTWGAEENTGAPLGEDVVFAIYIDGSLEDSTLISVGVPDNSDNWTYYENMGAYWEYTDISVNGTQVQYIDWEYGATFYDTSGYDNDATPTFRATSSDADVSASLAEFGPVEQAQLATFTITSEYEILSGNATMPSQMYTELDVTRIPGGEAANLMLEEGGVPRAAWWFPFLYLGICVIGLTVYSATTLGRTGMGDRLREGQIDGSLLVMFVVMEVPIAILGIMGVTPYWPAILFPLPAIAIILSRKHYSWG